MNVFDFLIEWLAPLLRFRRSQVWTQGLAILVISIALLIPFNPFWDTMLCSSFKKYRRFENGMLSLRAACLMLISCFYYSSTWIWRRRGPPKIRLASSRLHGVIQEDRILREDNCENLKSRSCTLELATIIILVSCVRKVSGVLHSLLMLTLIQSGSSSVFTVRFVFLVTHFVRSARSVFPALSRIRVYRVSESALIPR